MENSNITSLKGKGFKLVPVSKEYIEVLHSWECDISTKYLWTIDKEVISREEYENNFLGKLESKYHAFFVILNFEEKPIGFICSHDVSISDGYAFITAYISEGNQNLGIGAKVGILFFDYLFSYYPFRKIYCDVFEYNEATLSSLKHGGFKVEGTFNEHRYYKGRYHTMYRLALYREDYYNKFQDMISRVISK